MARAKVVGASAPSRDRSRLVAVALIASVALLGYLDVLPCPFAAVFSCPCPGCGLSRATHHLLAGEVEAALALHPLSPLVVPLAAAGVLWALCAELGSITLHPARCELGRRIADVASVILVALLLGVWVARFFGAFGGPVPVF